MSIAAPSTISQDNYMVLQGEAYLPCSSTSPCKFHWDSSGRVPLGLDSHHNHPPLVHWIVINLSIHHRRCRLVHEGFLLNEELGCPYAPFLTKIVFECSAPLFVMLSLYRITGP